MRKRAAGPADLVSPLLLLGFTEYEARAYLALSRTNPATSYEIAKVSGLPRANVYDALRSLEAKGAIQPVSEDPVRYVPLNPDDFFRRLGQNTTDLCRSISEGVKQYARADESVYVLVSRGEADVQSKLRDLISTARERIWIKAPVRLMAPVLDLLHAAARRGVEIKIIAFGEDLSALPSGPNVAVYPHEGDAVTHGAADVLFTITVDSSGVMIASYSKEVVGSYARNHSIVYVIQTLILHEIYFAEIYAQLGPQLEALFGKRLELLRKKHRPEEMERLLLRGR